MSREVRRVRPYPNRRSEKKAPYVDILMLFCVFLLIVFGLLMLYSVTAYKSGFGEVKGQVFATILGVGVMIVTARFFNTRNRYYIGAAALIGAASIFVLITPLGMELNGARRWFKLFGVSVQSAEIVKITLILLVADRISKDRDYLGKGQNWLRIMALVGGYTGILGVISSNLSSAIIIVLICGVMIFVADRKYTKYIGIVAIGAIAVVLLVVFVKNGIIDLGFRGGRIKMWLDPENNVSGVDSFQTVHGLYAIGSGGFFGKGIGEGLQKMKLPEAQNDMVFAVLCEELGLIGAIVVILLFVMLITRLLILATRVESYRDKLIVAGVFAHIALQAVLNIAVVTNTIPNTGVSLPFISSGGSSVLCLLFEIGLVLNVTKGLNNGEEE